MPRVNIYLNDKDYATWSIIINKSAFVSRALKNKPSEYCPHGNVWGYCAKGCTADEKPKIISKKPKNYPSPDVIELKTCKNGHTVIRDSKCLTKGCKYSVYA